LIDFAAKEMTGFQRFIAAMTVIEADIICVNLRPSAVRSSVFTRVKFVSIRGFVRGKARSTGLNPWLSPYAPSWRQTVEAMLTTVVSYETIAADPVVRLNPLNHTELVQLKITRIDV
jgi:hypothetical protein